MTPRQKQKRNRKATLRAVLCFVAAIAIVGTYTMRGLQDSEKRRGARKDNWRNRRKHWRKPVRKQVEMHRKTMLPSQARMEPEPVEKPKRVALVQERQGLQAKMLQQPETQMDPEIMATRTATVRLTKISRRQGQLAVHLPQTLQATAR